MKFTFEEEVNRKINFLDIDIQIGNDNEIITNVYRKETNNNTTIHKNSSHPWIHKINTYNNMINRAYKYINNEEKLYRELNIIKEIAIENGYDSKFINKLNKKYKEKTILNNRTTLSSINTGRKVENITYLTYKYTYRDL